MVRIPRPTKLLAAGLSALAGFVDATGFLALGGFFISFMSGNTTRMAVGLAAGTGAAALGAWLIGLFVLGVMTGTLARGAARVHKAAVVLALVAALLALAAALGMAGYHATAAAAMVLAMGAENAVFMRDGDVQIGLTYMTGTLVKFGQRLTRRLQGDRASGWASYLLLWLGLVLGGILGAFAYQQVGFGGLAVAVVATIALSLYRPAFRKS